MRKALVRPRGQAPAGLYLSSSRAGEREGDPPQLETAVEETGSWELVLRVTSFPANSVLGFSELQSPACLLCMEWGPSAGLSTCLGPTARSFPSSALFPFLFRSLSSPMSAISYAGKRGPETFSPRGTITPFSVLSVIHEEGKRSVTKQL